MGIFKGSMEFRHPQILLFCDAMDVRDRLHPEEMAGYLLLCTPLHAAPLCTEPTIIGNHFHPKFLLAPFPSPGTALVYHGDTDRIVSHRSVFGSVLGVSRASVTVMGALHPVL